LQKAKQSQQASVSQYLRRLASVKTKQKWSVTWLREKEKVDKDKSERGFASMSEDERREIAKEGRRERPDEKRSFSQRSELASEAAVRAASLEETETAKRRSC